MQIYRVGGPAGFVPKPLCTCTAVDTAFSRMAQVTMLMRMCSIRRSNEAELPPVYSADAMKYMACVSHVHDAPSSRSHD